MFPEILHRRRSFSLGCCFFKELEKKLGDSKNRLTFLLFFGNFVVFQSELESCLYHWTQTFPEHHPNQTSNTHENSVYIGNLHTVSTDNPEIMLIFLIYSLVLCWGSFQHWCHHEIFTITLLFITKILGGQKILCPPCPKVGGTCPPINSLPTLYH